MNSDIKQYMKELRQLLPFHGKNEKAFLKDIKNMALELSANNTDIGYSMICSEIGRPQDLIINYYSEIDPEYLRKNISTSSIIKKAMVIVLILIMGFIIYKGALVYDVYQAAKEETIYEVETTIE